MCLLGKTKEIQMSVTLEDPTNRCFKKEPSLTLYLILHDHRDFGRWMDPLTGLSQAYYHHYCSTCKNVVILVALCTKTIVMRICKGKANLIEIHTSKYLGHLPL